MAVSELLTIGTVNTLVQNQVYALPARKVRVHSTAALEISMDASSWNALTAANTLSVDVASAFIRCPGGAAIVTLRA